MGNNASSTCNSGRQSRGQKATFRACSPSVARFRKEVDQIRVEDGINPWSVEAHLREYVETHQMFSRTSPLRFIPLRNALVYYSMRAGGCHRGITEQQFVQFSLELFEHEGMKCPSWTAARIFYKIFGLANLTDKAAPSVSDLVVGLSGFYGGTVDERVAVICDVFGAQGEDCIPARKIYDLLEPCVRGLVPPSETRLHQTLLRFLADYVRADIGTGPGGHVSRNQLFEWIQSGQPSGGSACVSAFDYANPILSHEIVDLGLDLCKCIQVPTHRWPPLRQASERKQEVQRQMASKNVCENGLENISRQRPSTKQATAKAMPHQAVGIVNMPTLLGNLSCYSARARADTAASLIDCDMDESADDAFVSAPVSHY